MVESFRGRCHDRTSAILDLSNRGRRNLMARHRLAALTDGMLVFGSPAAWYILCAGGALMWLVPDRRVEISVRGG